MLKETYVNILRSQYDKLNNLNCIIKMYIDSDRLMKEAKYWIHLRV